MHKLCLSFLSFHEYVRFELVQHHVYFEAWNVVVIFKSISNRRILDTTQISSSPDFRLYPDDNFSQDTQNTIDCHCGVTGTYRLISSNATSRNNKRQE